MAETVTMPKLGFDMAEGTLVRWVIQEGEEVKKGAVLAEIETDKATVEVESTYEGVLARQLVPAGEVVPVNTPIAIVAAPGEKVETAAPAGEKPAESAVKGAAADQKGQAAPNASGSPESAAVSADGAAPAAAPAASANEPPRPRAGQAPAAPDEAPASAPGPLPGGPRPASPLARRLARDLRINLDAVPGSGPGGRIVKKDIESYASAPAAAAQAALAAPPAAQAAPAAKAPAAPALTPLSPLAAGPAPADQSIPLNRLRAAIGRRMVEAKQQIPHFYVTHEYDLEPILAVRKQANGLVGEDEKISVNDFLIKAAALTLRQFPNLNASLNGSEIVRHGAINVGVAVAVEGGLLTIVCREADRKPLRQIAVEVRTLAGRAREGKVRPDDIEGSTFSISNLGMFDVESFVAIINPPEAAILAVGSGREVPVVKDGQIVPGWRMKATLSVDHRVSDGAEAARFLQAMEAYIQEPLRLLL